MTRTIPATMASQHPDHAGKPYWHNQAFIGTHEESKEVFLNFSELNIQEYKWDWEGKLVDESVMERLLSEYYAYFQEHALGQEKFLTFRLPNPKVETEFRLIRAFTGMLTAAALAQQAKLFAPPMAEVILPMTETADEILSIQEAFAEIRNLKHPLHRFDNNPLTEIAVIPLFEQVDIIMNSDRILEEYLEKYRHSFGKTPEYLRPYVARSDPALNAGQIPTVMAIKIALSRYHRLAEKLQLPLYPIIGAAALPFRGGLTPLTVESFAKEYRGIRTTLLQSAFRYDYPKAEVIKAVQQIHDLLPTLEAEDIPLEDEEKIKSILPAFEHPYRETIEHLAPLINTIASALPKRRERLQHIGLFGYSRGVGKVKLPRAIGFTAALYSVGIPPELIGTGRGLAEARQHGSLELIRRYYRNIQSDLLSAGGFLNKENLRELAQTSEGWRGIENDIQEIEAYLGTKLGPRNSLEEQHQSLTRALFLETQSGSISPELITEAAELRKSLG